MITIEYLKRTSQNPSLETNDIAFVTSAGQSYEIPPEGSLGLLALGYQGIIAWRKKRLEVLLENKDKTQSV